MKKILFKIWKFPKLSETFIVNQVVMAIKLGYEVRILVEEVCDIPQNANQELFQKFGLKEKLILEDYNIPETKKGRLIKAVKLILSRLDLLIPLFRFYRKSQRKGFFAVFQFFFYDSIRSFEVMHIQFGTNKYPLDILKKIGFLNCGLITSFHGHDLYFPINNKIPNDGYYDNLFETGDFLICNTPFLKQKLKEINAPESKIKIIPVAVDTNYFKPDLTKKVNSKIRLVTVGRLETFKGQIWGISCVKELINNNNIEIEYLIVGDGSLYPELHEKVNELNLNQFIKFTGRKSQFEVRNLLQSSDIFLMTSVTDPNYGVESQGLVSAEAQACGLPVVAFNTGGVKYTLKHEETGFLCKEMDMDDFTARTELLIKDPVLRKNMGRKAIKFIEEEYSETSVISKWKEIYG